VVLEDEEPPLAASARAAPPPAMIPNATTVARALRAHLLRSSLTIRVKRPALGLPLGAA